jgi:hypothetical protein
LPAADDHPRHRRSSDIIIICNWQR